MNRLARRRVTAYAVDIACYLGVAAATVPLGIAMNRAGLGGSRRAVTVASALPVALATGIATYAEARGGTWGKRRLGLTVEGADGGRLGPGRSLVRNVAKIAIPWQLGHLAAIGAAFGGFDRPERGLIAVSGLTYAVVGVGVWGVLRDSGVTLHDLAAGSRVVEADTQRS